MNFSVLILLIAIILFGVLAFRQMSALILAPVVTIFVIVLSGMPILDTLLQHFMPATSDYITKYFLIFFLISQKRKSATALKRLIQLRNSAVKILLLFHTVILTEQP